MHLEYYLTFTVYFLHFPQVTSVNNCLCIHRESVGGTNIRRNPPTIKSVAVNFHVEKNGVRRITTSTRAFRGIPRTVPRDMKRGKVYAIPKLMEKLNSNPSTEWAQMKPQGICSNLSI